MSTDIDSDDPIYEVDRLSADKPQRRTVSAPVGPSTKLEPFIPVQAAKLAPFIPVQSAKLEPFIPVQTAKLEPFIPMTPATPGAEEPATPALRLAQEIATQYKPPAKSELPRLVAGETAKAFQDQAVKEDTDTLQNLEDSKNGNLPGLIKHLEANQVVSPDVQQPYLDQLKANATKEAQNYYGIKDPQEAYDKLMSNVGPVEFTGEVLSKIIPNFQSAVAAWNKGNETIDENRFMRFVNTIAPNGVAPDRLIEFKNALAKMKPSDRSAFMYNMLRESGQIDPNTGTIGGQSFGTPGVGDMVALSDSVNRILDPKWQADQAAEIQKQQTISERNLQTDPRLQGTLGGNVAGFLSALPKNYIEAITPGIGQNLMASEIYQSTINRIKQENPGLSEDEVKAKATGSTVAQTLGAAGLMLATGGMLGGVTSGLKNVFARVIASTAVHAGTGGTAGALQQISANLAEGRPIFKDVPMSLIGGLIQGAPGGFIGGLEGRAPPEALAKAPVVPTEPVPKVPKAIEPTGPETSTLTTPPAEKGLGMGQEPGTAPPVAPPVTTPPVAPEVLPPIRAEGQNVPQRTLAPETEAVTTIPKAEPVQPVSTEPIYEPPPVREAFKIPDKPAPNVPNAEWAIWNSLDWHGRDLLQRADPAAIEEYNTNVNKLRQNWLAQGIEENKPFDPEAPRKIPEAPQQLQQALNGEMVVPGTPPGVASHGETEPWVSKIANRYTAERMVNGELGEITPGQGYSKEDLLTTGLKMSPEQINQHVSDLMQGTGNPKLQAAAVRAEEARLSQNSNNLSRISEADPLNKQARIDADNAFKDLTDFHEGPVAVLKNNWHAQGMTLQGEIPVDLSTYNGLREAFLRDIGKTPPPKLEPVMRETAQRVRATVTADNDAMTRLGAQIEEETARRKLLSAEEVNLKIIARMKDMPCPT